ncbi:hypothetical protein DNK08_13150 [Stutzerimonas kirkiae]|nr:hypothetical protein DNK08_13150 [Stutzerimonas kirkiae]
MPVAAIPGHSIRGKDRSSGYAVPQVEPWPPSSPEQAKSSVYLKVQAEYSLNDRPGISHANVPALEKLVTQAFADSGHFSRVTTEQEESDVYVTVTLHNHETGSLGMAFVSGAMFLLIPGTYDNTLAMRMVVRDRDGEKLGQTEKREVLTTWMHLLLIFALPFRESGDELLTQLTRSALAEAVDKGLL